MLTIWGGKNQLCDRITRRGFLRVGTLGLVGGLTLADLLRLKAQGAAPSGHKAVIMVFLQGGPSHQDTYDLKPDAPAEFRGEFKPIRTNVSGMDICELMPLQAKIADKLAIVRNMRFNVVDGHCCCALVTGEGQFQGSVRIVRPSFGSCVSRLRSDPQSPLPTYVALDGVATAAYTGPAYLGAAYRPFVPKGPDLDNLKLASGLTQDRLAQRNTILKTFDALRRDLDIQGDLAGMDTFTARALEMISSDKARQAFDVSREPDKVREKYGRVTSLLQARRLVEAGVSVVTLTLNPADLLPKEFKFPKDSVEWDTHGGNFITLRACLPLFDQAVHALVTDLDERGLDKDVAVVMWGDLGRTPRINQNAGRDHWPDAGCALLIGGGLKMGQVVGATDAHAARPLNGKAYWPRDVLATLYHVLGIDAATTTLPDPFGRPQFLVDAEKIPELV